MHVPLSSLSRVKLPTGREVAAFELLRFCYELSETDIEVFLTLLRCKQVNVDTLAKLLNLSKATINRSLNKLLAVGLVERRKETKRSLGRPRYIYYIRDAHDVIEKLVRDLDSCTKEFQEKLHMVLVTVTKDEKCSPRHMS